MKLKCEKIVIPQSLKFVDLSISTDQRWILIPLRMNIFTFWILTRKLKSEQVESPQSLVAMYLQARDTCQEISYSGKKQEEDK
jgi:hypothetical protein